MTPVVAAMTTGTVPNVIGRGGVSDPDSAPVENGLGRAIGTYDGPDR